jgi:photosystem II stability/assembly factor-like uncharacterized protein
MKRLALVLLLTAGTAQAAPRRRAVGSEVFPPCAVAEGPSVTFSRDGGATVARRAQPLRGIGYTYGVAALDGGRTILAAHNEKVSVSRDAGCSWEFVGTVTGPDLFPPSITAAPDGGAYIWSDNREILARYTAAGLTPLKAPAAIVGLAADSTRVRLVADDGAIWTSTDNGQSWERTGSAPPAALSIVYRGAIDPANLDHVIVGTAVSGAFVTFDGGRNWQSAAGVANGFNVFNLVISPADPNVAWAMALNLEGSVRFIGRSTDGGRSFTPMIQAGNGVTLVNGPVMAAHPTNRDVFYFVFGTFFQDYGTDLFRFDAASGTLRVLHHDFDDIDAIAFSPLDPELMYLGLEVVEPTGP